MIQNTQKIKEEISQFINTEIMPFYHKFRSTHGIHHIVFLDEKLAIIEDKLNQLRKVDPESAERLYLNKIRYLPTKEVLLDEYVKNKYGVVY